MEKLQKFADRSKVIHGDLYGYISYTRMHDLCELTCKVHGPFKLLAKNHIYLKQICPECRKLKKFTYNKLTIKEFENKCLLKYENKYKYFQDYNGMKQSITVECKNHGKFKIVAQNHLYNNNGCIQCSNKQTKDTKWLQSQTDKSFMNFDGKVVTSLCDKHGRYSTKLFHFLNGSGCPICKSSKGEKNIRNFLEENNIKYIQEKRFSDCVFKKQLPFDFYLPDLNICIEYDGIQHFEEVEFFGGRESLEQIILRDSIKNKYCGEHKICLIRIKFSDNAKEKLEKVLL